MTFSSLHSNFPLSKILTAAYSAPSGGRVFYSRSVTALDVVGASVGASGRAAAISFMSNNLTGGRHATHQFFAAHPCAVFHSSTKMVSLAEVQNKNIRTHRAFYFADASLHQFINSSITIQDGGII